MRSEDNTNRTITACVVCKLKNYDWRTEMRICIVTLLSTVLLTCGCAFASNLTDITSVSQISTQQYQTITIRGTGFGAQAPYIGDSSYIAFSDFTQVWEAGHIGNNDVNAITLIVDSWTDSEITLGGFSGAWAWKNTNWTLHNGDSIGLAVINPQSGQVPAYWNGVVAAPEPSSLLMFGSSLLATIGVFRRCSC
jgi:hypothetical protein